MDKKITVLESGGILDFPTSVKIDNSSSTSGPTTTTTARTGTATQ